MEGNLPRYRLLQLGAPDRNSIQRNEGFNDESCAKRSYDIAGLEIL